MTDAADLIAEHSHLVEEKRCRLTEEKERRRDTFGSASPPASEQPRSDRLNGASRPLPPPPATPNLRRLFVGHRNLASVGITYSRKHLLEMIERGEFPRLVRLSANRVAWRWADIEAWAASREVVLRPADAIDEA